MVLSLLPELSGDVCIEKSLHELAEVMSDPWSIAPDGRGISAGTGYP